jgi:creatinine amidohydrolase/Fe(II)-dependent formamide hydrolase-like protein
MNNWSRAPFALLLGLSVAVTPVSAQEARHDMTTFERPVEMPDNVWIEQLTALEVRDLLAGGTNTALVLVGGIEENGPYLTTGKHNHVLEVMGPVIARKLGNTLVAPIIRIEPGNPERASALGQIRLSQDTYRAVLRDYATSLKSQGFTRIFMMGDSGGNLGGMQAVADELSAAWAGQGVIIAHIPEYYNYAEILTYQNEVLGVPEVQYDEGFHDNYYITSMIMNEDPRYVRYEERLMAGKASINGISISPIQQTLDHGQRLIEFRANATVEAIRKVVAEHTH